MKSPLLTLAALSGAMAASVLSAALNSGSLIANRATAGGSISVPLFTAAGSYYADISVGTPAQSFKALIGTGSVDLYFVDSNCTEQCDASAKFNASASSTFVADPKHQLIGAEFFSGTLVGKLGSDTLSLGGYKTASQSFLSITKASDVVAALAPGSALLGLSPITEASTSNGHALAGVPLWVALARSKVIAAPLFTLQLTRQKYATDDAKPDPNAKFLPGGVLTLGAVDGKQYTGAITYADSLATDAWILRFDSMKMNDKAIDMPHNYTEALIDSGTAYITGPKRFVDAIYAQIPGAEKDDELYTLPCDTNARFSLSFSGKEWAVNPASLVLESLGTVKDGKQLCRGTFVSGFDNGQPPSWIIGAPFLNSVFSVWEAPTGKQPRIGFASLKPSSK